MAVNFLVTIRHFIIIAEAEGRFDILHFFTDGLMLERSPRSRIYCEGLLYGLWHFDTVFVGSFPVTGFNLTNEPVTLTKCLPDLPAKSGFIV
jgi:hypothetical protein